jgi:D-alanyl-D-alanine carboxypeptidase
MRRRIIAILLALITAVGVVPARAILSVESIPAAFDQLLRAPLLANPAMILIDGTTGETVYERNSFSQRKPASLMKILSGIAVLKHLDPGSVFTTQISLGVKEKNLVIQGSYDPWISFSHSVARKMKRESLPYLAFNSMSALKKANGGSLKNVTVMYSGLYSQDVANLKSFWARRGFKPTMKAVSSEVASRNSTTYVVGDSSPPLSYILDYMVKWSDNQLADRLARLAARAAGNSFNQAGVVLTFSEILANFDIDPTKLVAADASGLSKENRITAQIMGQLLFKIRNDAIFKRFYESLPVSGVSGTLQSRFLTTAPSAVGLVRAKTGTLNGTVTLAGYVESKDREYIFVTLADEIPRGDKSASKVRDAIDRILGRIAAPNIPAEISEVHSTP